MIKVERALQLISQHRQEAVVVPTMMASREWPRASTRPELDLPLMDCMGKASSAGLGFALAQPDVRIIVLDGDGSLLMNLGSLVSIAQAGPENLVHVVLQNGIYEMSGGQPIPGLDVFSFTGLALAAGYAAADRFNDETALAQNLPSLLSSPGPSMVVLDVTPCESDAGRPDRGTREAVTSLRQRFYAGQSYERSAT